jgi:hypothetical protein
MHQFVRRHGRKSSQNFILTQRYDRYTIAAVISMRARFEPGKSSAMRVKCSRSGRALKIKRRRELKPVRPLLRRAADVEKARASRPHHARRSAGRTTAKVEVRRVRVRFEQPVDAVETGVGINAMRGRRQGQLGASRGSGSRILSGKSAVRVAIAVGGRNLVIVIVQRNLKQESCI